MEWLDRDGYPTCAAIRKIKAWPDSDLIGLMEFVMDIWWGVKPERRGRHFSLSTWGWSGNEEIIRALRAHPLFWALCWMSCRRGGHYRFHVPRIKQAKEG